MMKRFEGLKQWLIRRTYFIGNIWFSGELEYVNTKWGESLMLWNKKCTQYYELTLVNKQLQADVEWLLTRSSLETKEAYKRNHAE